MSFVNLPTLNNLQATTTFGAGGLQNVLNVNVVAGGGGGSTNTTVTTLYAVITSFVDGGRTSNVNDTLQNIQVLDATGAVTSSVWQNLTQGFVFDNPPPPNDIAVASSNPLTNAQLRATPVPMETTQLPDTLGAKPAADSLSVTSQQLPPSLGLQTAGNSMSVVVANPASLDNFPVATQFSAIIASTGVAVGNVVQEIQAFNFSTNPATLVSTAWENLTTQTVLAGAPPANSLTLLSGTGLTNAQLRASPVPMETVQLPTALGAQTIADSTAVNIASDQIVPISSTQLPENLGIGLAAGSLSVTQASDNTFKVSSTQLPENLGVGVAAGSISVAQASDNTFAVSSTQLPATLGSAALADSLSVTQASDDTFKVSATQLPDNLGQTDMAGSTSVVIASDQSAINVSVSNQSVGNTSSLYIVTTAFVDGSNNVAIGDILQRTTTFTSAGAVGQTIWFDVTQQVLLAAAPSDANVSLITPVGTKTMAQSASVTLASDSRGQTTGSPLFTSTTNAPGITNSIQYVAVTNFTIGGVNVFTGDVIFKIYTITPAGVLSNTVWFDQTTGLILPSAPALGSQIVLPSSTQAPVNVANPIAETYYQVITAGVDMVVGDLLLQTTVYDVTTTPVTIAKALWYNVTRRITIPTAPLAANVVAINTPGQQTSARSQSVVLASDATIKNTNVNDPTVAQYYVTTAGTGYAINDILNRVSVMNLDVTPITQSNVTWFNVTQQTILAAAPTASHIAPLANRPLVTTATPTPTTFFTGRLTTTTSAQQLPSNAMVNGIVVTANPNNTGTLFVGPLGVTTANGYPLIAGQSLGFTIANSNAIYIIGTNTTDVATYAGN